MVLEDEIRKSKDREVRMGLVGDKVIDGLLIGKGKVEEGKWVVNKEWVLKYVGLKRMNFGDLVEMEEEVEE